MNQSLIEDFINRKDITKNRDKMKTYEITLDLFKN